MQSDEGNPTAGKVRDMQAADVETARERGDVHHCHHPRCTVNTDPKMFACKLHWQTLPPAIRTRIGRLYRPGQEVDKKPSREWVRAARSARNYWNHVEGVTEEPGTPEIEPQSGEY